MAVTINTTNFQPIGTRICISMPEIEEKSAGGIVLTGSSKAGPTRGIIHYMPANPIVDGEPKFPFKVGDVVQFGEETGRTAVKTVVCGEPLYIINSTTLFGFYPQDLDEQ